MELKALREAIDRARTLVLTTHLNPDGDAIGSEVALALALRAAGKAVRIINHSETPPQYRFLENFFPITVGSQLERQTIADASHIVVLDANQLSRLGSLEEPVRSSRAAKICIDHHPNPEPFADVTIVDESSAATGQIVHAIIAELFPQVLSAEVASALYVAIMTDTGSFRFPKTDGALFRLVASLVESGADPVTLAERVYNSGTEDRLRLLGKILATLQSSHEGRVVSLVVTRAMFEETHTNETDTENVINYALSIETAVVALLFSEVPGFIKVSLRSKGDIPVNALAREFGGNGHTNAAGARIANGQLESVIDTVTARARAYLPS